MLEQSVEDNESFCKLFGIAHISDYSAASFNYPFNLTEVAKQVFPGAQTFHKANSLINEIEEYTGVNIKNSDNKYHRAENMGKMSFTSTLKQQLTC